MNRDSSNDIPMAAGNESPNASPKQPAKPQLRRISSTSLLGNRKKVIIEHQGQDYLLQVTRQNKLILTK